MPRQKQQGVSLIELIIGLGILAMLITAGAPSFGTWIQNTQIRTAAESIQNGLQQARSEAVRRNANVIFSFTTSVDYSCALSTENGNWVISLDDPSGKCGRAPSDTVNPRLIQIRSNAEGSSKAVVAADQSAIVFNGLGKASPAANICIGITNVDSVNCKLTGNERHLKVTVSTGGQVRMCDPARASTDPQGC